MADSLFDNRYRYDYIYPRGRSGETLRAVDTQDNDRPVVIKRPAPNDAPPIRAGQEVSILNERKALQRLSGHAVATALLGSGQFVVGGTPHQYIVMERGQGVILADMVRDLAQRGERVPELEMLVIIDSLLDLLQAAHARDTVYNDVDAKHLFWDRDSYRLKVIDWGNAVFLEGDEATPQGISRQSDIFQVGELLYSVLTGGSRIEVPRDAGEDFLLDFGADAERVAPRLQAIVSKAAHPNTRLRYKTIADLRKALADYREPLERERNAIVGRVVERLRHNRSKDELLSLLDTIAPALAADPGYPPARQTQEEILARLRDLEVAADLDAARIYMESANWTRAVRLLEELRERARAKMRTLIDLLLDVANLMLAQGNSTAITPAIQEAVVLLFERHNADAANVLLTFATTDAQARSAQWLLAERISAHTPDLLLFRPNLYRLETALAQLAADGLPVAEPRAVLAEINYTLERMAAASAVSMIDLRDAYRSIVDGLTALSTILEALNVRYTLPDSRLPFSALERALNAAMTLADNMHVIGRQATASPRDALNALDSSRAIDPTNPAWDAVARMLDGLYELLGSYQTYVPAADGADLEQWLKDSRRDLLPFNERLFDELLLTMIEGLDAASRSWAAYANATIQGDRMGAINLLTEAIDGVSTLSPTLAGWFNQLRTVITGATYIERHALYGGLGRALADGWEAFDRGRLQDAERLGDQALEIARSDTQRFAATRLHDLAAAARGWLDRNGVTSVKTSQATLVTVERLYTPEETELRENFTAQMPSKETYLKAMGKGLVDIYSRSSTAAPRLLFFNYLLLGTLDAHEGRLEDADFWREAALKVLGEYGQRHVMTRTLADFIDRRRDLLAAATVLNAVNGKHALATLDSARKRLEDNPQARTLAAGVHSLRELSAALRDWSDGEFRPAGLKLENAINAVAEVEQAAQITATDYRAWLLELQAGAAELHHQSRQMQQAIERKPEKPEAVVEAALARLVEVTTRLLGDAYAGTQRSWRETYDSFLAVYTDTTIRRSEKLKRFNQLFRAMFIDRHPAYPLYRHWYEVIEHSPEFPPPPTSEPVPQLRDEAFSDSEYRGSRYADEPESDRPRAPMPRRALLIGAVGLIVVVALVVIAGAFSGSGLGAAVAVTITDTPTPNLTGTQAALLALNATDTPTFTPTLGVPPTTPTLARTLELVTPTLVATATAPALEPPPLITLPPTPTATLTVTPTPTLTQTPSATPTPTATPTPSNTPTPTLPPQGLQGEQDLLALFANASDLPWSSEEFSLVTTLNGSYWRLGTNNESDEALVLLSLPANWLEARFGNNAASRIRQMEAELTLITFNPALLDAEQVYFGALLQDAADPAQTAGLHVQLIQPGVINIAERRGDTLQTVSQQSVSGVVVRVRLDRDLSNGVITLLKDGKQVGQPIPLASPDAALLPVLYVRSGGVIVSVTDWTVTLR